MCLEQVCFPRVILNSIIKLPANTTSKLQPLDAGIIAAYKKRFRSRQYLEAAKEFNAGQRDKLYEINVDIAIRWSTTILRQGISSTTIFNCFKHTTLLDKHYAVVENSENNEDDNERLDEPTVYGENSIRSDDIDFSFEHDIDYSEVRDTVTEEEAQIRVGMPLTDYRVNFRTESTIVLWKLIQTTRFIGQ
ncbi:unnamed protein product [Absidia cylindrospora]